MPATPGSFGAVADWARLVAALRLVPAGLAGAAFRLPPTAALVQQVALLAGAAASPQAVCRSRLLADLLSRQRIVAACQLLDACDLLTPLAAAEGRAAGGATGAAAGARPGALLEHFEHGDLP